MLGQEDKELSLLNKQINYTRSLEIERSYESKYHSKRRHIVQNNQPNIEPIDASLYNSASDGYYPICLQSIGNCITPCLVACPCCVCCGCVNPVLAQETSALGILQKWGQYNKVLTGGLHVLNPLSSSLVEVSEKTQILSYQSTVLSRDNVQFRVVIVLFFRVVDALRLCYRLGIEGMTDCLKEISMSVIRSVVGENDLQQIIANRSLISIETLQRLNEGVKYWGIYVQSCSVKDIFLEQELQLILSKVATTRRQMEAFLISCRAQLECGKLTQQISQLINTPASYQVRYLNTVANIIASNKSNILIIKTTLNS